MNSAAAKGTRYSLNSFIFSLRSKLNLKSVEDWDSLTQKQIKLYGGNFLLNEYSVYDIKCIGCPEGKYKFKKPSKPLGYWDNKENVQNFIKLLKSTYNLNTTKDWNNLTKKNINSLGGTTLFNKYTLYQIKRLGSPNNDQINSIKPSGYWDNFENIKNFISLLSNHYHLKTFEDWDSLTYKQILDFGGSILLKKYPLYDIKCLGFPNGKDKFKNNCKPQGYWNNNENIQNFLFELQEKFNLKTPDDWNLISQKDIIENGGGRLLRKFSMYDIKCLACPEGKYLFSSPYKSPGYWKDIENIKQFIEMLKKKFNVQNNLDWARISKSQILDSGGWGFLSTISNDDEFKCILEAQIPEISYIFSSEAFRGRSSQRWLFLQIQKLFPGEEIVEDYFHSELSRQTGYSVQFDIFLISRNIAFEYHGKQHYEDIPSNFAPLELFNRRDKEKKALCEEFGIHLIIIPYWWNNQLNSLSNTINKQLINKH